MKKIIYLLTVLLMSTLFLSCSEDEVNPTLTTPKFQYETITGTVEKGPFIAGTDVFIQELDENLIQTGGNFESIAGLDSKGNFELRTVDLESNYILAKAIGKYYNEITGEISKDDLSLKVYSDVSNKSTMNINVLSHLETERIDYLVNNGWKFSDAKAQAESEVLSIFEIDDEIPESELLDISNSGILLAISSIIQGYRTEAIHVQKLLNDIRSDIKEDGVLDDIDLGSELITHAKYLNTDMIKSNLLSRYSDLDLNKSIPTDFSDYIDNFINKSEYEIAPVITYPNEGGLNILDTSIVNSSLSISIYNCSVNILPGFFVKIKIKSDSDGPVIDFFEMEGNGWEEEEKQTDGYRVFKTNEYGYCTMKIMFLEKQNITIEYYENSEEVTYTKTIVVQ